MRNHQASAWNSLLTDTNKLSGGSQMHNKARPKQRKIIEISFDPKSQDQFPNFQHKSTNHNTTRPSCKTKNRNDQLSPNSSPGDSVIIVVTRAEFETLSQGISQMVKDEVQSTISTGTKNKKKTLKPNLNAVVSRPLRLRLGSTCAGGAMHRGMERSGAMW
jgi:hypothetical protein